MKVLEKIDWSILNTYIDNNLIMANKHPEYDLWILNYSPKVQSKKFWDDYTLSCRGLVIDAEGNIIARPFRKFKNMEEHLPEEIDMSKKFEVFEKMDGSLIILFYYEPRMEWIVASRGSFISEQMLEAQKMINPSIYDALSVHLTYLFEIIGRAHV
jgi:RNA ligase